MRFEGEQQFIKPSETKPEDIEGDNKGMEERTEQRREIKLPQGEEATSVEDNLKLEQTRGELKKLQEEETEKGFDRYFRRDGKIPRIKEIRMAKNDLQRFFSGTSRTSENKRTVKTH